MTKYSLSQDYTLVQYSRITSFPCRYLSVCVIIFLFISQIAGVNCDCSFDFLLGNFHAIIKNFEEFF
uniref:Uncharacterized protein n=1 Tax=Anolis carolinensis TaxID=28377 RepID=A0A803ST53_ANOCA